MQKFMLNNPNKCSTFSIQRHIGLARWRYLAPATFRSPLALQGKILPPPWPLAARSWSRGTLLIPALLRCSASRFNAPLPSATSPRASSHYCLAQAAKSVRRWSPGVEVCHAMVHGGPYPATSDSRTTSVGSAAIFRFLHLVCYQALPDELLPEAIRDGNPCRASRLVDGKRE